METKVLVAYGTKYGATAEIAEKIGQVLRQAGLAVDVKPAGQADDPATYQAVVLGSAIYMGRWRKEAETYLQVHEQALGGRPVWLFSSGPLGEGDPATLAEGFGFPGGLQSVADRIRARDVALFHGAVDTQKLNPFERMVLKMAKPPVGDWRDWNAIAAWAAGIAVALTGGQAERQARWTADPPC